MCYLGRLCASFVNRSERTLLCGQARGTGNIFTGEESSTLLSQQCLTESFILLFPDKVSI